MKSTVIVSGWVCLAVVGSLTLGLPAQPQPQPSPPSSPSASRAVLRAALSAGLTPDVLAASGISPQQAAAALQAVRDATPERVALEQAQQALRLANANQRQVLLAARRDPFSAEIAQQVLDAAAALRAANDSVAAAASALRGAASAALVARGGRGLPPANRSSGDQRSPGVDGANRPPLTPTQRAARDQIVSVLGAG